MKRGDVRAFPEIAKAGLAVYRRGVGWGMGLFLNRERDDEKPIGEVVLVGTWLYDKTVPQKIAIIKLGCEYSSQRYREDEEGELVLDTSKPPPVTPDGYVYQFLGTFGRDEYQSLEDAIRWAKDGPWGPVTWDH